MSVELRTEWACEGCGVRVRNASGEPIPQPKKWSDDGSLCMRCRVDWTRATGTKEEADALEEKLGFRRRRSFASGTDMPAGDPSEPKEPTSEQKPKGVKRYKAATKVREAVKAGVLAHPDWTNRQISEEIGIPARTVSRHRRQLDLPRPRRSKPSPAPA